MLWLIFLLYAYRDIIINAHPSVSSDSEVERDNIRKQSAAFVYEKSSELKVLLIKSSGRRWIFPKGTNIEGQANYTTARINALCIAHYFIMAISEFLERMFFIMSIFLKNIKCIVFVVPYKHSKGHFCY